MDQNHTHPAEDIFLEKMIHHYKQNISRLKPGYRYSEDVKLYAAYIRMLSGKLAYETFKANTQHSVPSVGRIDEFIKKTESNLIEGVLRSKELSNYLSALKLPRVVALSEDATRINNRIQYDSRSNQLVGFILPMDANGMPVVGHNQARSASEIESCFYDLETRQEKKKSSYINVVMAQPIVQGIPAFCILLFGTDAKYGSVHIQKRWKFISEELEKEDIKVLTFASDSDQKFNSVMRNNLQLGRNRENGIHFPTWFNANLCASTDYIPIQDTVHIGTKFRNRMLNTLLKMGNYEVSENHLALIMERFTKEKHGLCPTNIKPKDRQNFDSVLRICDDRVIELLSNIEGSEGTAVYLKMMSNVLQSFLDPRLTPLERIRYIWVSTFFLRIWKKFISESKRKHTVKDNFISQNCYSCVEINAHSLVFLMIYLKERNLDHLFHAEFFGSQQCECFFRQIRSLTSTYSTVTNCSLLEVTRRISKIELQNEISHIKLKHFNFPRIGLESSSYYPRVDRNGLNRSKTPSQIPNQQEIRKEIELAMIEAVEWAESLGMNPKKPKDYSCSFQAPGAKKKNTSTFKNDQQHTEKGPNANITETVNTDVLQLFGNMNLKQYSEKNVNPVNVNQNSQYVKVKNGNGETVCVKKTTLCWLLEKSTTKLSSDRLIRSMAKTE